MSANLECGQGQGWVFPSAHLSFSRCVYIYIYMYIFDFRQEKAQFAVTAPESGQQACKLPMTQYPYIDVVCV